MQWELKDAETTLMTVTNNFTMDFKVLDRRYKSPQSSFHIHFSYIGMVCLRLTAAVHIVLYFHTKLTQQLQIVFRFHTMQYLRDT